MLRQYGPTLTIATNLKGVLDVDTVKGCSPGTSAYPNGGCYGECYAYKIAIRYGFDFTTSVTRTIPAGSESRFISQVERHTATWYRVGVAGDPSVDWDATINVCQTLVPAGKAPVIITKHWITLSDDQVAQLSGLGAIINTSTSPLDTDEEIEHRVSQTLRLRRAGLSSVLRVVTCSFGSSPWAREREGIQSWLLSLRPVIDNPLRARLSNPLARAGDIRLTRRDDAVGGGKYVSLHDPSAYLGTCESCPDQCGATQGGTDGS